MDTTHPDDTRLPIDDKALDGLAVAPPHDGDKPMTEVREGLDARDVKGLARDPSDDNAKLDVALDETFPTSDAPSNTQPGKGKDPAPSSGFDDKAEARTAKG